MKVAIHLKTARVYSHGNDGMPKIERSIVKLDGGDNFKKFVRDIPLTGYISAEPPEVKAAYRLEKGEWKEIDKTEYQDFVTQTLSESKEKPQKVDYKELSEKLLSELQEQKRLNDSINERLKNLEKNKPEFTKEDRKRFEDKANELKIEFRANIGDANLLKKIQEVEQDFK